MAFDGITVAAVVKECRDYLLGSRIYKIAQPEADELLLTLKTEHGQKRLLISAGASLPLVYLTEQNKPSPLTAPGFCMLLRKHLQNGRIVEIVQPGLERIIEFHIEHLNEMGDLCRKKLIIEIMGKHSNIIFCDEQNKIIDSIKHISGLVSSVREVLPGREYFIPKTMDKIDPVNFAQDPSPQQFSDAVFSKAQPLFKAIYSAFTGISPVLAHEFCFRCGLDADRGALSYHTDGTKAASDSTFLMDEEEKLYAAFLQYMNDVLAGVFSPAIVYENGIPKEFSATTLTMYAPDQSKAFSSISDLLENYYAEKNAQSRIRQKSSDLRRIVQTALERNIKKYDLQLQQIKDTEKREKYRIYGELLHTYGYQCEPGAKSLEAENYYDGTMITIPLDPTLTASENAKRYFEKYNKMKRTYETLSELTISVKEEIDHLQSVSNSLDIAVQENDLAQIKEELIQAGYIRRKGQNKKVKFMSKPFHYISSDGFHIYIGKNNMQNDELTFKFATGNDWWFHAKKIPGSHVVVKAGSDGELPDRTFEEAARLAAYYSQGREQDKVEIDYIQKKHVKKPAGSKPGFVVYYTNFSMAIDSNISSIQKVEE